MLVCPVDLGVCERPGCRGGHCEMAQAPALLLCWECGAVESHGVKSGVCVACLRLYGTRPEALEA
jgi:hypothetical protein